MKSDLDRIDLRSDTVSLPTNAMLSAMNRAELGDDVYGEDPTVRALETRVAAILGKENALFVPSGTMGNLCAILSHCARGVRLVAGDQSHIVRYEAGGASVLGGVVLHPVENRPNGDLDRDALAEALVSPDDPHVAAAGLLALENTHARCGGAVLDLPTTASLARAAREHGVAVHLDGARLWNAACALGATPGALAAEVDSVQVCFSKGLAAPAGSALAGSDAFVRRARRVRKLLGGGMRQAGVLAAACLVALDGRDERVALDHEAARTFTASAADELPVVGALGGAPDGRDGAASPAEDPSLALLRPRSNIVVVHGSEAATEAILVHLRDAGVLLSRIDRRRLRAVFHHGVDPRAAARAGEVLARAARLLRRAPSP